MIFAIKILMLLLETDCPAGTASTAVGATSSSFCAACSPGLFAVAGSESCQSCPANSQAPSGSDTISDCACNKGYFNPSSGQGCMACSAGKFKDSAGLQPCTGAKEGKLGGTKAYNVHSKFNPSLTNPFPCSHRLPSWNIH